MTITKTKKNTSSYDPVLSVVVKPGRIDTADISAWKNAVNAAKQGRRNTLYNLYENILADGLLSRAIEKRIEAITNAELVFMDGNNERVIEMDMLIDTPEFELLIREIMQAKFWGYSVIDIISSVPFDVYSTPRKNVNLVKKLILPDETNEDSGFPYDGVPYIIEVKDVDNLGMLYKAAPYVIYKRGGFGDWAQFVELFGMPFRVAKYSSYDQTTRNELIKSLKDSGGAGWAVVPKEAEFTFIENKASGNGALYTAFIDRCDKEMLIAILGQTMTTMEGSSRAQSDTHKEVEEGLNKSDQKFVQRILNRNILPILESAGYPVKGGFFSFTESGEVLTTQQKVEIAMKLIDSGLPVSDDYIYETAGVPKPKDGDTVSSSRKAPPAEAPAPDPGKQPGATADENFMKRLVSFFVSALGKRAVLKF